MSKQIFKTYAYYPVSLETGEKWFLKPMYGSLIPDGTPRRYEAYVPIFVVRKMYEYYSPEDAMMQVLTGEMEVYERHWLFRRPIHFLVENMLMVFVALFMVFAVLLDLHDTLDRNAAESRVLAQPVREHVAFRDNQQIGAHLVLDNYPNLLEPQTDYYPY